MSFWDDTIIREVLIGIIGNGLWSLIAQSGSRLSKEVRDLSWSPKTSDVLAIRAAIESLTDTSTSSLKITDNKLLTYLKAPETESIVRQLFATSLTKTGEKSTLEFVKREFTSSLSKYLDVDEHRLRSFADSLLSALVSSIELALEAALKGNILSAHEAKSAARHRMLMDEISNLQKNVEFLSSKAPLDIPSVLNFERKYREVVGAVHANIRPPQLESGRRVPIDEIFVAPKIEWIPPKKGSEREALTLEAFLGRMYRAVLLGNPGGGKSTTSAKICFDLATQYARRLFAGREITPALIILREYGSQKKTTNCSIVEFLEQQAASRYQLKSPPLAFEYLLFSGRLLVIFDGLDELLDTSYRQEVTLNVETFCSLYPSVPVLVTSREIGYEQAPLNDKMFDVFRLAPFDEQQVRSYAEKWFARDEEYSTEQKIQKSKAFFSDSALVPDLRRNPLMLGLMCNLYRAEGYIPRNRPEVYGKCSMMLFERWDKSRDIVVPLPFEEHIRPAMQDLAFWIYSNEELQGGVTEHALITRTSDYLCKWVFDNTQKSRYAACDFIRFCTGRAWVFTDTGTTREGERLFQFTHRTFLEYFTATYMVSIHPTPTQLMGALMDRITRGEWDVVAQLSFQIQSKQVHGAADQLLSLLLTATAPDNALPWSALSFAERALEFLVPSPGVRRQIARAALNFWLEKINNRSARPIEERRPYSETITESIGGLLLAAPENRDTIGDEIKIFLEDAISSAELTVASAGAELMLNLSHPLFSAAIRGGVARDVTGYWDEISRQLVTKNLQRILHIASQAWPVALQCYWRDLLPMRDGVAIFGIPFLLVSARSNALGELWYYPPGFRLVDSVLGLRIDSGSLTDRERRASELEGTAELLLRTPTPWVKREHARGGPRGYLLTGFRHVEKDNARVDPIKLSPDGTFAMFCICAADVEYVQRFRDKEEVRVELQKGNFLPQELALALFGRFADLNSQEKNESLRAVDSFALPADQKAFVSRWINGEIDLLRVYKRRPTGHQPKRKRTEGKLTDRITTE